MIDVCDDGNVPYILRVWHSVESYRSSYANCRPCLELWLSLPRLAHGERHVLAAILELGHEALLVSRLHVGFLRLDKSLIHEVDENVAELDHSELAGRLHHGRNLEGLSLTNEIRYGRHRQQDFPRCDSTATDLLAERLGDHAFETVGKQRESAPDDRLGTDR